MSDEMRNDLTNLVVATSRMRDHWAESDKAVQNQLWRDVHTLADEIAVRHGLYPLGNPDGPEVKECGYTTETEMDDGLSILTCRLPEGHLSMSHKFERLPHD